MQRHIIPKVSRKGMSNQALGLPLRVVQDNNKFVLKSDFSSIRSTKKVQMYLSKMVASAEVLSGIELNDLFERIISYDELGSLAFGFLWGKLDPNDPEAKAVGTEENKRKLLGSLVESSMAIVRTKQIEMSENQTKEYFAVVITLQGLADLTSIVNTCFFFFSEKSWAGWIFVATIVVARLYNCLTVYLFERKPSHQSYAGSLVGTNIFYEVYRVGTYSADARALGVRLTSRYLQTIRRTGTALLQLTPQMIVNFYIFFDILKSKSSDTGLLWIQMITMSCACLSLGVEMAMFDYKKNKKFASAGFYESMSCFMPSDNDPAFQKVMFSMMTLRYIMHYLIVCMGLGVLSLETPVAVWLSIVICFIVIVNVLRYISNDGSVAFFIRPQKSLFARFCACVGPTLLYGIGAGLMPLALFRYHCVMGPTAYGFAWLASLIASIVSVFVLMKDLYVLGFFGGMCVLYMIVLGVFFTLLRKNTWHTFFFSTVSWKQTLANEFLKDHFAGSMLWNERTLHGDEDAHYAGLIGMYCDCDLPWKELKEWLHAKKDTFTNSPPIWMSHKWISLIPKEMITSIWKTNEFSTLIDAIRETDKQFARQHLGSSTVPRSRKKRRPRGGGVEKSKDQGENSDNEDSSSKGGSRTMSATTSVKDQIHVNVPKVKLPLSKGELVDPNQNPESNVEHDEQSVQKQKEKTESDTRSRNEASNEDTALQIANDQDNALRKKAKTIVEKRKSSFAVLTDALNRTTEAKDILESITVPDELTRILTRAVSMKLKDIRQVAEDSLNEGLAKVMIEEGKESKIISIMLCAVLRQLRQMGKEDKNSSGVLRTALAGFFEVADEVSDIILAGIFYSEAGDVLWAAHLMFVFMGLNRAVQFATSMALGQSLLSGIEGLIGIKCITDTYRMIRDGAATIADGQLLSVLRALSLAIGITFESFPQMLLQVVIVLSSFSSEKDDTETSTGVFIAQLSSITMSAASIGLSIASVYFLVFIIFFISIKEPWYEFLFTRKPRNWKECLRDELWNLPHHGSPIWGIPELVGDRDASHAGHIISYRECFLPWDKIEEWLNDKKASFLESPPIWMTVDWFDYLPPEIKKKVWNEPGELDRLLKKVQDVMEQRQ
eukprot:g2921.t1